MEAVIPSSLTTQATLSTPEFEILNNKIEILRNEMKSEVKSLETEITSIKTENESLRNEMKTENENLRNEIGNVKLKFITIYWILGAVVAVLGVVLAKLFTL